MPAPQRAPAQQAQTVSNAVAVNGEAEKPRELVKKYAPSFGSVLPTFIAQEMFVAMANAQLAKDPQLAVAARLNPISFVHALMDCAYLGHLPGKGYALTARGVRKDGTTTDAVAVLGIEEYTGKIERMYRAGAVRAIKADVVKANDHFVWQPTTMDVPEHKYNALASDVDRGELIGVYAYAVMLNGGTSQVVVMNRDRVMKAKAKAATSFIWDAWPDEQWLKTALRRLEKFVPTSSEYLRERARASAEHERALAVLPAASTRYGRADEDDDDDGPAEIPAATDADKWPEQS
jgi:recombination protein RecT